MDFLSFMLSLVFAATLIQVFLSNRRRRKRLPPGPTPLPVIGNLLKLGNEPHKSLAELAKVHGPIMTLKLGQVTTVVVSSSAMAKEVLQKHDLCFSDRSTPDAVRAHNQSSLSAVWLPVSPLWRSLRKIMNSHIFSGFRLDAKQDLRCQKVRELVAYVHKCCQAGVPVDVGRATFITSLNLLSNTMFSVDLVDPTSDTAQEFKEVAWSILEVAGKPNLVDFFPVLSKIDPQSIRRQMAIHFGKMIGLFQELIDQRLKMRSVESYVSSNDVIDALLDLSEDMGNDEIDRIHIERMLLDLFVAGTDTTSETVEWAMAEMLRNPETLLKAKAELEEAIGKAKLVEESDIARLPYLQAVVKETFRLHPTVPFLIPRKVNTEVDDVGGFTVPKAARVLVNAWAIGRDSSIWANPASFVPERFLGSDIDVRGGDFELIPFGGGRRMCPGLPLAMRMVHLMVGSLINSFDWKLEYGIEPEDMDMEEKFGITLRKAQPLRAVPVPVHV